ncbi:hypothetical protein JOM56_007898 [Amanita muscaria]
MNSSSAAVEASASTMERNNFRSAGRDMFSVTVNNHPTIGDGAEVRQDGSSGSIATVFVTLTTLLGGIFGPKASEIDPNSSGNIPQQPMPDCDARDHSGPRAFVTEIQDIMASAPLSVLDTNSTVSLLTQASSSERYIRSMLDCNEGFPLYEPEPENQEGVRIGDVGLVTEDGGFDVLFNVCPPADISTNPAELPDDFEMLRAPEILIKTHFQSETRLFSNGVKRTEDTDVKYTCSGPEGGVLELPSGATRFGAKDKLSFKELAIRHAENWYRYTVLTRRRDAPNGSLYIVTSCIKSTDWGIAVFDRPSNPQDYLRFITNEENQTGQSKYRWKGSGAYKSKVAPNPGSADSNAAGSPNQCVFLRGYKIMLPEDIWNNITNSQSTGTSSVTVSPYQPRSGNQSESPRQGDSSNQDDASQSGTDNSPVSDCGTTRAAQNTCSRTNTSARVILYEYSKTSPAHPSDLINAILLCQKPKAKVALTHDDDWCDLLQYQQHSKIHDSEALTKFGLPYTSNVDEYGCASLIRSDLNPDVTLVQPSSDAHITSTLALGRQDYWHPFNATPQSSTPHSQSGHHIMLSTIPTLGSDVNHAYHAFSCDEQLMAEEEDDKAAEHDYILIKGLVDRNLADVDDKLHLSFDGDKFSQLGDGLWPLSIPAFGPSVSVEPAEYDLKLAVGSSQIQQAAGKRRKKAGIHQCPFRNAGCNATFTARHNLRYHLNSHRGLKPYKCNKCSYAAASPATTKRHQANCKGTSHSTEQRVILGPPKIPHSQKTEMSPILTGVTSLPEFGPFFPDLLAVSPDLSRRHATASPILSRRHATASPSWPPNLSRRHATASPNLSDGKRPLPLGPQIC